MSQFKPAHLRVSSSTVDQLRKLDRVQVKMQNSTNGFRVLTHARRVQRGGVPESDWIDLLSTGASLLFPELSPIIMGGKMLAKQFMSGHENKQERKEILEDAEGARREVRRSKMEEFASDTPSMRRLPEKTAATPNLLAVMSNKPGPARPSSDMPPVRFAPMPQRLEVGDVPVLHGSAAQMTMKPVITERTENHCAMSGSEYLGTLQLSASMTNLGQVVYELPINPRMFPGTKLSVEFSTWEMYAFRKLVIEYIPIQGSSTVGSFVGYFTADPSEIVPAGIAAVRSATEHTASCMFQPFFHTMFANPVEQTTKGTLFYCDRNMPGDERLEIQSLFRIVQNVANTTGIPFGSFIMHYEIDGYYPTTTGTSPTLPTSTTVTCASTTVNNPIKFNTWNGTAPTLSSGILQVVVGSPLGNFGSSYWSGSPNVGISVGKIVYMAPQTDPSGTVWYMYQTLEAASYSSTLLALYPDVAFVASALNITIVNAYAGYITAAIMSRPSFRRALEKLKLEEEEAILRMMHFEWPEGAAPVHHETKWNWPDSTGWSPKMLTPNCAVDLPDLPAMPGAPAENTDKSIVISARTRRVLGEFCNFCADYGVTFHHFTEGPDADGNYRYYLRKNGTPYGYIKCWFPVHEVARAFPGPTGQAIMASWCMFEGWDTEDEDYPGDVVAAQIDRQITAKFGELPRCGSSPYPNQFETRANQEYFDAHMAAFSAAGMLLPTQDAGTVQTKDKTPTAND